MIAVFLSSRPYGPPRSSLGQKNVKKCTTLLKKYLSSSPILVRPLKGMPIYVYMATSLSAVSSALVMEVNDVQPPIYFTSTTLQGSKMKYQILEKSAFALLTSSRRLRHHFHQCHMIVLTNQPLRQILHWPDLLERLASWSVELN